MLKKPRYKPNQIPDETRVKNGFLSICLVLYGVYGLWRNDLFVPARRGGIHFQGPSAWVLFAAMLMAVAVMVSVIIDHHDRRDNEHLYRRFGTYATRTGWTLFWIAGVLLAFDVSRCGCTGLN